MEVVWGDELGVGAMKLIGKRIVMWVGMFDLTWLIDFEWVGSMMLGCTLVEDTLSEHSRTFCSALSQ